MFSCWRISCTAKRPRAARKSGLHADGNNVDIDLEMGRLQKNTLLYRVYTQILAVQLGQMRSAIGGR